LYDGTRSVSVSSLYLIYPQGMVMEVTDFLLQIFPIIEVILTKMQH
jgi:hypothetical protein